MSSNISCYDCTIAKKLTDDKETKYFCPILNMAVEGHGCDPVHMIGLVFQRLLKLEEEITRMKIAGRAMR